MALSEAALKKLSKNEIINLALDYQIKFNSTLAGIRNELSDLKKYFEKLYSDLSVATQINLESTVFEIFEKLEVKVNLSNAEDCHWISSKNAPKRVIAKVSKFKGASKICSFKRKLKDLDLTSIGISNPVYINDSLCT